MLGGREGIRTPDPLLAKQMVKNTKVLRWCRLHGKSTKFSLSSCPEVVPNAPSAWLSLIAESGVVTMPPCPGLEIRVVRNPEMVTFELGAQHFGKSPDK
jgi:hypothetical protein